jgi:hypothetical protein
MPDDPFIVHLANSIPLEERLAAIDEAKNAMKSRKQISKYRVSVIDHLCRTEIYHCCSKIVVQIIRFF